MHSCLTLNINANLIIAIPPFEPPAQKVVVGESPSSNVSEVNSDVNNKCGDNKDVGPKELFELVNTKAVENTAESNERYKPPVPPKLIRHVQIVQLLIW